jgi:succinoglycan biosynthesis protein ExoL
MEPTAPKKIVFLLGNISESICIKRIKSFISAGFPVEVYGFDRGKYNVNAHIEGLHLNVLGFQPDGRAYVQKAIKNQRAVRKIFARHHKENPVYYSFGFVWTAILRLNGCKCYIYEIADVLYGYNRFNAISWLFRMIDKNLINKSIFTVLTSAGYGRYLYGRYLPVKIKVHPNRIDHSFMTYNRPSGSLPDHHKGLVFSYVGAFRYPNTIFRFTRIIGEQYPDYEFHFYGDSELTPEVIRMTHLYHNVKFFGPFRNPEDLPGIYSGIDIVVACYDTQSLNERIAEPNKLYESLYFRKPIIVSGGTFLAERVTRLKCGYVIDASHDENIISLLENIRIADLQQIVYHIDQIPLDEIVDDNAMSLIRLVKSETSVSCKVP